MTENTRNRAFAAAYRALRPSADVYKVNDRITPGRPDLEICDLGQTWYLEGKMLETGIISEHQARCLTRLCAASRGRVLLLWYSPAGIHVALWGPLSGRNCGTVRPTMALAAQVVHDLIAARAESA